MVQVQLMVNAKTLFSVGTQHSFDRRTFQDEETPEECWSFPSCIGCSAPHSVSQDESRKRFTYTIVHVLQDLYPILQPPESNAHVMKRAIYIRFYWTRARCCRLTQKIERGTPCIMKLHWPAYNTHRSYLHDRSVCAQSFTSRRGHLESNFQAREAYALRCITDSKQRQD